MHFAAGLPATAGASRCKGASPAVGPGFARAEKSQERLDHAAFGSHGHLIDRQSTQEMLTRFPLGRHLLGVGFSNLGMTRVDFERVTGLWIDQARDADIRKLALARILDRDRHDVVTLRQQLERVVETTEQESESKP